MVTFLGAKRLLWGIIFGLVTVMGWISYVSGRRYVRAETWVEHTLQVQSALDNAISAVQEAEDAERGFLLTGDTAQLDACRAAQGTISHLLQRLMQLIQDNPVQQTRVHRLSGLVDEKTASIDQKLKLALDGQYQAAIGLEQGGSGAATMTHILEIGAAMAGEERRLLELRKGDAIQAQTQAIWGIGLGPALTITLSLLSLLSVHRDVEALRKTAEELAVSEEHFRLITENGSDLVCTQDLQGKTLYVSPSVERILGYSSQEYIAFSALDLVHPDDRALLTPVRNKPISETYRNQPVEYRILHKDGRYRWLEINFGSLRDRLGKVAGVQSSARDVTARRLAEERLAAQTEQLRLLSLRDELTGLYNRRGWLELAAQGLRVAIREQRTAAVIFGDLNGMKQINDQHGHEEGDCALQDTARVLASACRKVDVIARFGGDEFVVFALDFELRGLTALRERTRQTISRMNRSGERPFLISLSLGAAFFSPETPESIEQLLDRADAEMYERKRARRENGGLSLPPPEPS